MIRGKYVGHYDQVGEIPASSLVMLYMTNELEQESVLPELYHILGEDKMFEVFKVFGGRKIDIPSIVAVRDACEAVDMWHRYRAYKTKGTSAKDAFNKVAQDYSVPVTYVLEKCKKVKKLLRLFASWLEEEYGERVRHIEATSRGQGRD